MRSGSCEPRRFQSAAPYYLGGRPPYAPLLIRRVVERCALDRTHRVMDLGCGPGQLALAFVPFVREVVAIDPEPEMLRIAADQASQTSLRLTLMEGSSTEIGPRLGRFRLVTIGRAFHWMDRAPLLARLATMIDASGALALFATHQPDLPDNRWHHEYERVLDRYTEFDAARARRKSPDWIRHEAILLDSPFSQLERISVVERRQTPVERLVDRALSRSSTSPGRLGRKADELIREIRALMTPFAQSGLVTEVIESEALIARRPMKVTSVPARRPPMRPRSGRQRRSRV